MRNRRTSIFLACFLLLGAALAVAAPGCRDPEYIYTCNHPLFGRTDHTGGPDPCCDTDPCPGHCLNDPCPDGGEDVGVDAGVDADATASCAGDCVPIAPLGWMGPVLLRLSPDDGTVVACPDRAPVVGYQGHADLVAPPPSCGVCTCSPSSGTCSPPVTLTASAASCPGGLGSMPFDGPAAWDGTCTANEPIPNGMCNGSPCHALMSAALVVTGEACTPTIVPPPQDPSQPSWKTAVLACEGTTFPLAGCMDHGSACVPAAAPDFRMCIFHEDDTDCPSAYPDKQLVFADYDDQRDCTPCACGPAAGSSCTGTLGVFTDGACSMLLLSASVGSSGPACFDIVPAGQALRSKTLTKLAYQPGTCAPSGGEAMGTIEPFGPSTFCCLAA
jgi:hypothetical protein